MAVRFTNNYQYSVVDPHREDSNWVQSDGKVQQHYPGYNENHQLNNDKMTIEMMVDYIQADLTFSGLMPKVLPDQEILRVIKEKALEWFYKNYQLAVMKSYFKLNKEYLRFEQFTRLGYIIMPEEVENVVRIVEINDPSLFRIGVQAPNLSINFGVTNQPYLTSFVTNVGELGVYRQILSAFSDEINKMSRNYTKYTYNSINHRLHILDQVRCDMMLEVYVRIEQEEIFNNQLFKDYCVGLCQVRLGQILSRMTFNLPGGFNYSADSVLSSGNELLTKTEEAVKAQSPASSFFIMKR